MIYRVFIRRNLDGTLRRYRVVLVVIATGAAALLVFSAVIGQGAAAVSTSLSTDSAISSIRLDSMTSRGDSVQLTKPALDKVRAIDGVVAVEPWAQEALTPEDAALWLDKNTPLAFWGTPRIAAVQPKVVAGKDAVGPREILLPNRVGDRDYTSSVGRKFHFSYIVRTGVASGSPEPIDLLVVGVYDNSHPGQDGEIAAYISPKLVTLLVAAKAGLAKDRFNADAHVYPSAFVQVRDVSMVEKVQSRLVGEGYGASSIVSQVGALPRILQLLGYLNLAIAVALALLCVGAGLSIGSASLAQRGRDIGLLRALGWGRRRVLRSLMAEIGVFGVICAVLACLLGIALSFLANSVLGGSTVWGVEFVTGVRLPALAWLGIVLIGLPAAVVLGAVRPMARLARIDPDDALRQL